jgi:hypothetical protein
MSLSPPKPAKGATQTAHVAAGLRSDGLVAEQAIAQLLGPIAQLMIDHGVQLSHVVEQLKYALVQQADEIMGTSQKESSESRVALLTGVHRKDIKRLRQGTYGSDSSGRSTPVHMAVVSRWISEPHFLNADQTPRPLAKTSAKAMPGEPDFTTLVAQVSKDVGARAVLDELLRVGIVHVTSEGLIVLNDTSFVPKGQHEALDLLAANVHDHLAAAVHNVKPGRTEPTLLEQSAFSHGLTPGQAEELHGLARQLWTRSLQQFLQAATIAEERSQIISTQAQAHQSVRFGVYFHSQSYPAHTASGSGIPVKPQLKSAKTATSGRKSKSS